MIQKLKNKYKSAPLRYVFYTHISDIPDINWDLINPKKNIFLSLSYLKTLEQTLSKTISFRYILFYDKETPVGFATAQLIKFNPEQLKFQEFPCKISDTIKNTLFKNTEVGVLICGNLFSCGEHGFVYNPDLVSSIIIFDTLSNALSELRKSENSNKPSFILLKEFWPSSFDLSIYSKEHDFREFKIDANMVLKIHSDWHTFDDYLASMRSKFRARAKNILKKSEKITKQNFTTGDIDIYKDDINTLYLSVIEKADFKIGKLNASTFKSLKKELNDSFIFTGYFLEHKLVGFATSFIQDNIIEANHIGIDYEYNTKYAVYQKMLYDYVTLAINKKAHELRLGRTAETIKSCVGAKPVDMKLYVRHGNSISNTLLKPLVELISPSEHEIRNPFKIQLK